MEKITFCIPSKDNLRYLKSSINSILENSSSEVDIIVYVDSDNDGTCEWLDSKGIKYLKNSSNKTKGIAYGYNRCIESAKTDIVCMFHADMYMAEGFDTAILRYIKPKSVVSGTRIEPPLHPEGKEKIVRNFGLYPEDFNITAFKEFVDKSLVEYKNKVTKGIFAPWAIYRQDILDIGMHDEQFHSYHEDSDIFNRFILSGYNLIQTWEGFVYHLTCRGGQFKDGIEKVTQDESFHKMKSNAFNHYIKKWGSWIKNDEFNHPILTPVYRKKLNIINSTPNLNELHGWFNGGEDIIVTIDGNTFTQEDFKYITLLNGIIKDSGSVGKFKLGNISVEIIQINEHQNELIKL
jgi:glycosyltransferase involved in cell wall biosynthesis